MAPRGHLRTSLPRSTSRAGRGSPRDQTCPSRSAGLRARCRRSSRTPPTSPASWRVLLGYRLPWRLEATAPDGARRVFVRSLDAAGAPVLPASIAWTGWTSIAPRRCSAAGARSSRSRSSSAGPAAPPPRGHPGAEFQSRCAWALATGCPGVRVLQARSSLSPPRAVRDPPLSLIARPGGTVEVRAVNRAGNASRWRWLQGAPAAAIEVLDSADRPFTRATACPSPGQALRIQRVNSLWRAAGAPGGDRASIRPGRLASDLDGLLRPGALPQLGACRNRAQRQAPRRLGGELSRGRLRGRRDVELLRSRRRSRLLHGHENLFAVPEDGHPPRGGTRWARA